MARNTFGVDEELRQEFNARHLKRITKYMALYRKELIITIILVLVSSGASLCIPLFIKDIIDNAIPGKNINQILIDGGIILCIVILLIFIHRFRVKYMAIAGQGMIHKIRRDVFENLQRLPFEYYDSRPHGKILIRVVNYVNSLSDMLSNGLVNVIAEVFVFVLSIGFMLYLSVPLALIAFAGVPVMALGIFFLKDSHRRAWQIYSNKNSNLTAYIQESLLGMKVTQSFSREEENLNVFKELSADVSQRWLQGKRIEFLIWPIIDIISNITIFTALFVGIFKLSTPIGTMVAFINYVWRFWQPIVNISNFYNTIITNMAYLERIFETIDEKPAVTDVANAQEMPAITGEVTFDRVNFSYDKGHKILEDLSFTVPAGSTIALVGQTGAGKTTVINLISRFYNLDSGRILVDGIDISKVTLKSLRRQMGIMLQDSFIFSGSIIENIRYGRLDASDEEVIEAAKAVCADEFISQMDNGYYTEVVERGSTLSVGERQLISFARALLADPKILILDEATSSIDTQTELLLQRGLERLLKGRTSFVIAHRLSTIKNADNIMVIGEKNIMEQGTHENLLKLNGVYAEMYKAQFEFLNN